MLDPQGLIKGSSQISIYFHYFATIACRAYKFGVYIQHAMNNFAYIPVTFQKFGMPQWNDLQTRADKGVA